MKLAKHVQRAGAIAAILSSAFTVVGRQPGKAQGTRARLDPIQRELQRRFESEAIEKALAQTPRHRAEHEQRMVLLQIQIDFLRIQIVNDDLQVQSSAGQPDLKLISKSDAEISRCAQRLKENLALPAVESLPEATDLKVERGMEQLRLALSVLSKSIGTFVENPVFEHSGVVDATLSAQAQRDLTQIIQVSRQVKRGSEKLRRAPAG